jgi:hypothetical protein
MWYMVTEEESYRNSLRIEELRQRGNKEDLLVALLMDTAGGIGLYEETARKKARMILDVMDSKDLAL